MITTIASCKHCDLEEEHLIQDLVDSQWKDTKSFQKKIFYYYLIFYLIPYFVQIQVTNKYGVIGCNISCLLCQYSLLVYEYVQIRDIGVV